MTDTRRDAVVRAALFLVSLGAYVLTAAPGAFWLDSSELAAAGASLGVPHAPGHPLYVILGYAASLLPFGPLGFRVTLVSALCAAWAVVLVYDLAVLADAPADGSGRARSARVRRFAAATVALTFGASSAVWLQSVRAEVYTLQLALALWLTRTGVAWLQSDAPRPARFALAASVVIGLGAGNHHYLLLFHVPCLLVLLLATPAARRQALRLLPAMTALALVGLGIYALLPLRAATDPLVDYGDPRTLSRLIGVVSAKMFQVSLATAETSILANLIHAGEMFLAALGPVLLAAPVGAAVLWRRGQRALAAALVIGIAANLATKVLMDLNPDNPDAAGYFEVGVALCAVLAGPAIAALLEGAQQASRAVGVAVVAACMVFGGMATAGHLERSDLSSLRSPAAVDTLLTAAAPPDALWMPSLPFLHFNRLYHRVVEGSRPDLALVHQGLDWGSGIESGRPFADLHTRRDARLGPLLEAHVSRQEFPAAELLALARSRPVLIESTPEPPIAAGALRYAGGYLEVTGRATGASRARKADAGLRAQADVERLLSAVGPEARTQADTRQTLLLHFLQLAGGALSRGQAGEVTAALSGVAQLSPGERARQLVAAAEALEQAVASGQRDLAARIAADLRRSIWGLLGLAVSSGG